MLFTFIQSFSNCSLTVYSRRHYSVLRKWALELALVQILALLLFTSHAT